MQILRTPDSRFEALPEFPFAPHYVDVPSGDGATLRVHYVDEGPRDAPAVLMLHGEPTWSYLYRKVIATVSAAGLRAVAPDLVGFGRSDKPTLRADYTYQRHVDWTFAFLSALDLRGITLLCQDWGGFIGLRLVAEHPGLFARVIAANTGLPTGDVPLPAGFYRWQRRSQEVPEFLTGKFVKGGCARPPPANVVAAYDAPFPDASYQAGARQFPMLVPISPHDPATEANRQAWEVLSRFEKPFLTVFGDGDLVFQGTDKDLQARIPGAKGLPHRVLAGAGHFLQEDVGEELGKIAVGFARS